MKSLVVFAGGACLFAAPVALADAAFKGFAKPFSAELREKGNHLRIDCAGNRCRLAPAQKKDGDTILIDFRND